MIKISVIPVKHNYRLWIGETWRYRFEWQVKSGNAVEAQDVTDYKGTMIIVPSNPPSETPWLTITEVFSMTDSGILFLDETGLVDITISDTDTETITWKQANFEFKVVNPIGETIPLIVGKLSSEGSL